MASEKQVAANQRNAAKSTGPRTANGKLQSRRNAVRHGLTAATVVPAMEDAEEFERFEAAIRADYDPVSTIEHELISRLVSLLWRLRRATLIETNLFQIQARLAKDRKLDGRGGSDTASPGLKILYQLLYSPDIIVPHESSSDTPALTNHGADDASAKESPPRYPNPATVFLRLCNLNSFPIERLNRYEIALWRQAAQTLFLLDNCRKRMPFP